jgi:hypothetical protein
MAGPLRCSTGDLEAPTINAKKYRWRPPLGGGAGGPGAPTINVRNVDS